MVCPPIVFPADKERTQFHDSRLASDIYPLLFTFLAIGAAALLMWVGVLTRLLGDNVCKWRGGELTAAY
jgi:hypothetical protein